MSKKLEIPQNFARPSVPQIKAVRPFGSRILVETLNPDETLGTTLYVQQNTKVDGAPQAYIIELGPQVPEECGLRIGQRIYWEGRGCPVQDPRSENGRVRALLEISNVRAIIED